MSPATLFARTPMLVALFLLSLSGCYKTTFVNDTVPPGGEKHTERLGYFLWGIAGDHEIDTRELCKNDVREIVYEAGPLGVLVGTLTLGIVSLRNVDIECAGAATTSAVQARNADGRSRQ